MTNMDKISDAEKQRVKKMYDCEENPLVHQIKPRGTFDIIESRKITKEDFNTDTKHVCNYNHCHCNCLESMDNEIKELKKQVEELQENNKQLIFELQDEAKFGLYVSEEMSKLKQKIEKVNEFWKDTPMMISFEEFHEIYDDEFNPLKENKK